MNVSTSYSPFVLNVGETRSLSQPLVVSQGGSLNQGVADVSSQMEEVLEIA